MNRKRKIVPTSTHWGNYRIESDGRTITAVHPYEVDTEPTPIGQSLRDALDPDARIPQPMVRAGYLDHGRGSGGSGRGREPFVQVPWETALDLAADALRHTMEKHGPDGIYGGYFGLSSAVLFLDAQSEVHRFLRLHGG